MDYWAVWAFAVIGLAITAAIIVAVRWQPWRTLARAYPRERRFPIAESTNFCSAYFNLTEYGWSLRFSASRHALHVSRLFGLGGFTVPWEDVEIRSSQQSTDGRELIFRRCPAIQILVTERLGSQVELWKKTMPATP